MNGSEILSNSKLGMAFGFTGFVIKAIKLELLAQAGGTSLLSTQNIIESSVIAAICTLIGLIITALVNYVKRKWLGIDIKNKWLQFVLKIRKK